MNSNLMTTEELKAENRRRVKEESPKNFCGFEQFSKWCLTIGINTDKDPVGVWYEMWEAYFESMLSTLKIVLSHGQSSYESQVPRIEHDVEEFIYYSYKRRR